MAIWTRDDTRGYAPPKNGNLDVVSATVESEPFTDDGNFPANFALCVFGCGMSNTQASTVVPIFKMYPKNAAGQHKVGISPLNPNLRLA